MQISTDKFCELNIARSLVDSSIKIKDYYHLSDKFCNLVDMVNSISSPIEKIMFSILLNINNGYGSGIIYQKNEESIFSEFYTRISSQVKVGKYTADFVVSICDDKRVISKIIIECDGHNFHEKTKGQAKHDKKRDRFLKECGYDVYRFTGSEIYTEYEEVQNQLNRIISKLSENYLKEITHGK